MTSPFRARMVLAVLLALTLASFAGVVNNGFLHWDDRTYVTSNPHIHALTLANLQWMLLEQHLNNWHPLTWLSHALDYAIWGPNPAPHHLTSVFIHLANVVLVFLLSLRIQRPWAGESTTAPAPDRFLPGALLAAALFALHPQHVESVAWVAERKDVLSGFFYLLALLLYLRAANEPSPRKRLNATLICFLLALMAKPMAISLPVVLLLLDVFPLRRLTFPLRSLNQLMPLLAEKAVFFFLSLVVVAITLITQDLVSVDRSGIAERFLNADYSLFFYLGKWLLPWPLSPFYPVPESARSLNWVSAIPIVLFLFVSLFCLHQARRGRSYWLVGWLYYLVTVLPVIGLVKVGEQAAADRYTYLPLLPLYLGAGVAIAWGIARVSTAWGRRAAWGTVLLLLGALGIATARQIPYWANDETLWRRVIELYPGQAAVAHQNLGNALFERNDLSGAESEYRKGLAIAVRNLELRNNLALTYEKLGRLDEAMAQASEMVRLQPDSAQAHRWAGEIYQREKQLAKAEDHLRQAWRLEPQSAESCYLLGRLYLEAKRVKEAMPLLLDAVNLDPKHVDAQLSLGVLFHLIGNKEGAIRHYQTALSLDTENAAAKNNLAVATAAVPTKNSP